VKSKKKGRRVDSSRRFVHFYMFSAWYTFPFLRGISHRDIITRDVEKNSSLEGDLYIIIFILDIF